MGGNISCQYLMPAIVQQTSCHGMRIYSAAAQSTSTDCLHEKEALCHPTYNSTDLKALLPNLQHGVPNVLTRVHLEACLVCHAL